MQLVSFFSTYRANEKLESAQLNNRISNAIDVFQTQINNRRYYLSAFAETAAKDYGLKSVLDEDNKSFLVALNNHRKRINSNLAMAVDNDGLVFAQLVTYQNDDGQEKVKIGAGQGSTFAINSDLFTDENAQIVMLNENLYQLSLAPIKSGARIIGWIGFGYLIDVELASELATLTDVNIAFAIKNEESFNVLASSVEQQYPNNSPIFSGIIANTEARYIYHEATLGPMGDKELVALLFKSKVDILEVAGVDWLRLTLLIVITVALSVTGALAIARSITKPITQLVSQVKAITRGSYDGNVTVDGSAELEQLSDEFNHMTKAIISREETISFQAFHDPLSHMPNRNALINALNEHEKHKRDFLVLQICFLDADKITDTLGYKVGDDVVKQVAHILQNSTLPVVCFHLGRENFVVMADEETVQPIAEKLLNELNIQCEFDNISLNLQFVMGVAISSLHRGSSGAELLQKSNVALQHAKKNKKVYQVYDPQFDINALERLFLTNSLKQAIEENELVLFYQPKLCLKTMTISHVEALVRWQHPEKGLIPPDSFISIAEKTGQMDALTRWVTKAAVAQYVSWLEQGIDINIAINISAQNILDKDYPNFVIALKEQHQLRDNAITLEVTEDAVVADPEKATEILCFLYAHGFKISIDDYGTGYSSLAQLKQLQVQELKIDRSFVQHLATNENDQIIVRSTLELAHNLGLSVVAEGIEDDTALQWLKAQGCELAQGYFISKPLPAETLDLWMKNTPYHINKIEV
ncbi:EAL domain-containing protein [Thalassotalea sp. M1531]|uniref:EAL domain-containing protein n=1 Tax=Thalassotalea algicola TaxID=2716224 RepID=A0A7Y0LAH8_9GAMM|nr:EAL domain-containing protein [Thalassotalea algicola]NMP30960.1 EAL domain-containing protein [Thalassotalea algicola]